MSAKTDYEKWSAKEVLREVLGTSLYILIVLILSYLVVKYIGQRTVVIGSSMESTLQDGDNLIVNKIGYIVGDPGRFDVVVFPYRYGTETQATTVFSKIMGDKFPDSYFKKTYYVKRIIGLPGETVRILDDGTILINGEVLEESYGREVMTNPGRAATPITLGENEYFVLGDNRNNSKDSRWEDVGNIRRDELLGKVWLRVKPLPKFGTIK